MPYLLKAIKLAKKELNDRIPLIGFSGAPFTLASYLIEGGGSRNYVHTKSLMYNEPELWHKLMAKITDVITVYLKAQVASGVDVVQVFDSWAGCLSPGDYREFVLPYTKKVVQSVRDSVPVINFSTNTGTYLDVVRQAGGDVIGIDWKVRLDTAWKTIGYEFAIQGNIDPTILFAPRVEIRKRVKEILDMAGGRPGHIFNLGHGIIVGTPVDNVRALVDAVHELSGRK